MLRMEMCFLMKVGSVRGVRCLLMWTVLGSSGLVIVVTLVLVSLVSIVVCAVWCWPMCSYSGVDVLPVVRTVG